MQQVGFAPSRFGGSRGAAQFRMWKHPHWHIVSLTCITLPHARSAQLDTSGFVLWAMRLAFTRLAGTQRGSPLRRGERAGSWQARLSQSVLATPLRTSRDRWL